MGFLGDMAFSDRKGLSRFRLRHRKAGFERFEADPSRDQNTGAARGV
jgi:hypothetical protein